MANETIVRDAINYAHDLVVKCGKLDLPHKMEAHNAIDRIEATYKSDIENLEDNIARLVEMQNPDIQVQKTIALEKLLNKQKAINKNLVDQNADLLADLKWSNEQYQHIVDLVSAIIETRIQKEEKNGCEGK